MRHTDEKKRSKRGAGGTAAAVAQEDMRNHCVSTRMNKAELATLDQQRAIVKMQRGEYLRAASLYALPQAIPGLNATAYAELARSAANLNQIARYVNSTADLSSVIKDLQVSLEQFRSALIGMKGEQQ